MSGSKKVDLIRTAATTDDAIKTLTSFTWDSRVEVEAWLVRKTGQPDVGQAVESWRWSLRHVAAEKAATEQGLRALQDFTVEDLFPHERAAEALEAYKAFERAQAVELAAKEAAWREEVASRARLEAMIDTARAGAVEEARGRRGTSPGFALSARVRVR